jgi:hypothetical protein
LAETAKSPEEARRTATATAATGQEQNATVAGEETFTAFAKALSQVSPTIRAKIAQQLKDAGIYRGKVSGDFNNRFYDALIEAEKRRAQLATIVDVPNRYDFIASLAVEGEGEGAGAGGVGITESLRISTPEQIKPLVDAVIMDQLGRKATSAEIKRYTKMIRKAQKAQPTVTTTKKVGDRIVSTTTGGFDSGQYLVDQIAGTDEGKANRVLGFYETFLKALGGE